MNVLLRYKKKHQNRWQYEEYGEGERGWGKHPFTSAIYGIRRWPDEYASWAIYRVSDMRILAQSKDYRP